MAIMKICKYCHQRYDFDSLEEHECEQMIIARKEREKRHREKLGEARKVINNRKWRAFRKDIILRDGGYCQRHYIKFGKYVFDNLEVHHIIPRVDHPELAFEEDNVITLCRDCNLEMGLDGIDFEWTPTKKTKDFSL